VDWPDATAWTVAWCFAETSHRRYSFGVGKLTGRKRAGLRKGLSRIPEFITHVRVLISVGRPTLGRPAYHVALEGQLHLCAGSETTRFANSQSAIHSTGRAIRTMGLWKVYEFTGKWTPSYLGSFFLFFEAVGCAARSSLSRAPRKLAVVKAMYNWRSSTPADKVECLVNGRVRFAMKITRPKQKTTKTGAINDPGVTRTAGPSETRQRFD